MRACCFTGHRDLERGEAERLTKEIRPLVLQLIGEGILEYRVGGAVGFDMVMAELLLKIRDEEKQPVRIISMIPYPEWRSRWRPADKERQDVILEKSDEVRYIRKSNCRGVYMIRNKALADGAECCIAYCMRPTGGTAWTVRYALQKGLKVYNFAKGGERISGF